MKSGDMLKVISIMRHDFLNHLQVISGYLQLNKKDRAGEYIREVTQNLNKLSKVVHLKVPEIAAAFLLGEEMAAGIEAQTVYNVKSDLDGCAVPGAVAGQALHDCLLTVFRLMDEGRGEETPCIMIDIFENGENCGCKMKFKLTPGYKLVDESWGVIEKQLVEYGGQVNFKVGETSGEYTLELLFPRKA